MPFRFPTMTNIELTERQAEGVPPPDGQTNGGTLNKAYDKADVSAMEHHWYSHQLVWAQVTLIVR